MSTKEALDVGALVVNERLGSVMVFMGEYAGRVHLRPVGGGRETTVSPNHVRPASPAEALSARVAAANRRSRGG
ncbi:hypothetical protein VM98_25280 [Streptomyces rubellomurinus subsp. indigoferus]|nr:hypothetical protein VM98_25280 [Streptomyces rubellomurinus subsp. indigoferus]